jgi:hypothetical protein
VFVAKLSYRHVAHLHSLSAALAAGLVVMDTLISAPPFLPWLRLIKMLNSNLFVVTVVGIGRDELLRLSLGRHDVLDANQFDAAQVHAFRIHLSCSSGFAGVSSLDASTPKSKRPRTRRTRLRVSPAWRPPQFHVLDHARRQRKIQLPQPPRDSSLRRSRRAVCDAPLAGFALGCLGGEVVLDAGE